MAALRHYGVEPWQSARALVMELVPGPDLAARLADRAIEIREALRIAREVADGLAAAHDQGVIHRDLKPANIKAPEGAPVKVLDFGLAKALVEDPLTLASDATVTSLTAQGIILGTAAYMSPEQARGKPVDKRTDVWAFGCVLFEMLTGTRAFQGEDVQDTLVAVLSREPEWRRLPDRTPPAILTLLRRCLAKNRRDRLADLQDARLEIDDALAAPAAGLVASGPKASRLPWMLAAAATVAAILLATAVFRPPATGTTRFDVVTPPTSEPAMFALSPDAGRLVFVADAGDRSMLWLRDFASTDGVAGQIAGTEGATFPFWSPDGGAIGFFADGKLKRVTIRSISEGAC